MQINFLYDTSVNSAPPAFKAALAAVAQAAAFYLTDPIQVNIKVGWGEINGSPIAPGALANSLFFTQYSNVSLTYAQLKAELMQYALSIDDVVAITNMPASSPFGSGFLPISSAQAKAWGLLPPNSIAIDGAIGFDKATFWDFDQSNGISPNLYDFTAAAYHEITETLGRIILPTRDLLDLFRYSSVGAFGNGNQPDYFSIDGGKTNLSFFAFHDGDEGDWSPHVLPDAFDTSGTPGQVNSFSLTDFTVMDVLGFNLDIGHVYGSLANNVALPALTVYQKMAGTPPTSDQLWNLKVFDAKQSSYGQAIGVLDATVYMYEALGSALADAAAFVSKWGPLKIGSDATFLSQAYVDVFGSAGMPAQIQHFVDQINFFKSIYTSSGAFGDSNHIDLVARGAVYGQMLGIKAASAGGQQEAALVGVSAQQDTITDFV